MDGHERQLDVTQVDEAGPSKAMHMWWQMRLLQTGPDGQEWPTEKATTEASDSWSSSRPLTFDSRQLTFAIIGCLPCCPHQARRDGTRQLRVRKQELWRVHEVWKKGDSERHTPNTRERTFVHSKSESRLPTSIMQYAPSLQRLLATVQLLHSLRLE